MQPINANDLQARLSEMAVFDVRGDADYEQEHIKDAMTAPMGGLSTRVSDLVEKNSPVVVYSSRSDELSMEAAESLESLGLDNVFWLEDGIEGWKELGFETDVS